MFFKYKNMFILMDNIYIVGGFSIVWFFWFLDYMINDIYLYFVLICVSYVLIIKIN